jgi:hypothetical protein
VHDATLVRVLETFGHLRRDRDGFVFRDGSATDSLLESLSGHQLQRQEADAARFVEAEYRRHVRVKELRQDLRFTLESREALGIAREGRRQHLDSDLAFQRGVGGPIDLAHAAFPELGSDLVRAEALAWG